MNNESVWELFMELCFLFFVVMNKYKQTEVFHLNWWEMKMGRKKSIYKKRKKQQVVILSTLFIFTKSKKRIMRNITTNKK